MLPKDPVMLMSVLNTKLRDRYDSLEALCDDLELNRDELTGRLQEAGIDYDPERNQFRLVWASEMQDRGLGRCLPICSQRVPRIFHHVQAMSEELIRCRNHVIANFAPTKVHRYRDSRMELLHYLQCLCSINGIVSADRNQKDIRF